MRRITCWHCGKKVRHPKKYGHHFYCGGCYKLLQKFRGRT